MTHSFPSRLPFDLPRWASPSAPRKRTNSCASTPSTPPTGRAAACSSRRSTWPGCTTLARWTPWPIAATVSMLRSGSCLPGGLLERSSPRWYLRNLQSSPRFWLDGLFGMSVASGQQILLFDDDAALHHSLSDQPHLHEEFGTAATAR